MNCTSIVIWLISYWNELGLIRKLVIICSGTYGKQFRDDDYTLCHFVSVCALFM